MSNLQVPALFDTDSIRIPATASWLPASLKKRLEQEGRIEHSVKFSKAERAIYRKRTPLPVSEWAEKNRVITMSSLPGPWHNESTPYLTGIMDASNYPGVQTVILCKAPQVGGSEIAHNFVGAATDQQPGPVLYVYPDEQTAKDNSKDRILPMINSSPRLRSYLTGVQDDTSVMRISLKHMPIYMAWATSPNRLANKPIKYLILDEIDKYPPTSGKRETDAIALAEMRTNTFSDSRVIWKISTPTTENGNIWHALNHEAQVIFDYWVTCPHCGALQRMEFDRIKWPKDQRDPEKIEALRLAEYACSGCSTRWDDEARNRAVKNGHWRSRGSHLELFVYLGSHRPKKIGFHLPAWLSRFVSLSEIAGDFLRGQKDKTKLKKFMNQRKAVPWIDYAQDRQTNAIMALRDPHRPRGKVPADIAGLTIGIDSQDIGYYYRITAWGYGMEMPAQLVAEGKVETNDALEEVIYREYEDPTGLRHMAMGGFIDTGGHRTSEIYDWCRLHQHILPLKGKSSRGGAPVDWSQIDYYPGTKIKIPGGLILYKIDTIFYKDMLASKLEIKRDDPGAYLFHSEIDDDYAAQLCVEYRDAESGKWDCPKGKANHQWDCSVYDLAYAHYRNIRSWVKPDPAQPQAVAGGRRVRNQGVQM